MSNKRGLFHDFDLNRDVKKKHKNSNNNNTSHPSYGSAFDSTTQIDTACCFTTETELALAQFKKVSGEELEKLTKHHGFEPQSAINFLISKLRYYLICVTCVL